MGAPSGAPYFLLPSLILWSVQVVILAVGIALPYHGLGLGLLLGLRFGLG